MVVAIVAALLAVGAIVYGWLSSREQEDIYGYEEDYVEQVEVAEDTTEQLNEVDSVKGK